MDTKRSRGHSKIETTEIPTVASLRLDSAYQEANRFQGRRNSAAEQAGNGRANGP